MNGDARRAEFVAIVALISPRDLPSVAPRADNGEFRRIGRRVDVVFQPERAQRLDGVGRKPDAGADLGKLGGLFADDDLGGLALECERRRKPADPAADDQNPRCPRHLPSSRHGAVTVCLLAARCQLLGQQTRDAHWNKRGRICSSAFIARH
jgi:hypothetical protein